MHMLQLINIHLQNDASWQAPILWLALTVKTKLLKNVETRFLILKKTNGWLRSAKNKFSPEQGGRLLRFNYIIFIVFTAFILILIKKERGKAPLLQLRL